MCFSLILAFMQKIESLQIKTLTLIISKWLSSVKNTVLVSE